MKISAFVGAFLLATAAQAETISEIVTADCSGPGGSYVWVDVPNQTIRGRFGSLPALTNEYAAEHRFVEVIEDYPQEGTTALGSLAASRGDGEGGIWGNLSLLAPTGRDLSNQETLTAFFTDTVGNAQREEINCILSF